MVLLGSSRIETLSASDPRRLLRWAIKFSVFLSFTVSGRNLTRGKGVRLMPTTRTHKLANLNQKIAPCRRRTAGRIYQVCQLSVGYRTARVSYRPCRGERF